MTTTVDVFIAYADNDDPLRAELVAHLAMLRRRHIIRDWHNRSVQAGEEKQKTIDEKLDAAQVVLLLVSADFLNSDYCYQIEMRRALERHHQDKIKIIPVILRDCDWSHAPFGAFEALPLNALPVTSWQNRDEAWRSVVAGIDSAISGPVVNGSDSLRDDTHLRLPQRSGDSERCAEDVAEIDMAIAARLVRTRLPILLSTAVGDPMPVLIRANVPTQVLTNRSSYLDQWTYVCDWLARGGVSGLVHTFAILDEVQTSAFCESVSRWAAELVTALVAHVGPVNSGSGGGILLELRRPLKQLVDNEARRWDELRKQVQILRDTGRVSDESLQFAIVATASWGRIADSLAYLAGAADAGHRRAAATRSGSADTAPWGGSVAPGAAQDRLAPKDFRRQ